MVEKSLRLNSIENFRDAAAALGFECLDEEWRGWNSTYHLQCELKHVFPVRPPSIAAQSLQGCSVCISAEWTRRLHEAALSAGVTCLEPSWLGTQAVHCFSCPQGHQWSRSGRAALVRSACPECTKGIPRESRILPEGLDQMREVAASRGGECLAIEYHGVSQNYTFCCSQGHQWNTKGASILRGTWCPFCTNRRVNDASWQSRGMKRLQAAALNKAGVCLCTTFLGTATRYRFRCHIGHEWKALGYKILRGGWCPTCATEMKRLGLDTAHKIAADRGGKCLSTEYVNTSFKLHWLCHRGHSWFSAMSNIRAGHWCPDCAHMAQITNPKSKAWKRYNVVPLSTDGPLFGASDPDTPP